MGLSRGEPSLACARSGVGSGIIFSGFFQNSVILDSFEGPANVILSYAMFESRFTELYVNVHVEHKRLYHKMSLVSILRVSEASRGGRGRKGNSCFFHFSFLILNLPTPFSAFQYSLFWRAHTAQAKAFAPLFAYSGVHLCYNVLNKWSTRLRRAIICWGRLRTTNLFILNFSFLSFWLMQNAISRHI